MDKGIKPMQADGNLHQPFIEHIPPLIVRQLMQDDIAKILSGMSALGSTTHGWKNPISSGDETSGLTHNSMGFLIPNCSATIESSFNR